MECEGEVFFFFEIVLLVSPFLKTVCLHKSGKDDLEGHVKPLSVSLPLSRYTAFHEGSVFNQRWGTRLRGQRDKVPLFFTPPLGKLNAFTKMQCVMPRVGYMTQRTKLSMFFSLPLRKYTAFDKGSVFIQGQAKKQRAK